jgi:hypothetical protein
MRDFTSKRLRDALSSFILGIFDDAILSEEFG